MPWSAAVHPDMQPEIAVLSSGVRVALLQQIALLEEFGPTLGRPTVDTLAGSRIANLKELRFNADGGVWRVAFAFNGARVAILLVAGNKKGVKAGGAERRFYEALIAKAEQRWESMT